VLLRPLAFESRLPRALAVASLALGVALGASACGAGLSSGGDVERGKKLFVSGDGDPGEPACGSCHTLADAGTLGTIGPNLDDAFGPDRRQGFDDSTIQQVVEGQIRYPVTDPSTGQPGMPANLVAGDDVTDVAAYVARCAGSQNDPGCGGGGGKIAATDGKTIFAQAGCGGCHVLADAGSSGTTGPNLDQSRPDRALAVDRVTNGRGGMPPFKDRLTKQQIDAVAQYVSSVAGK